MKKMRSRYFSLLEVMITVAILAIAAGALFYRLNSLIDKKRFESDVARLKSLFLSTRMLALNSQTDWRIEFQKNASGWAVQIICREDADLHYPIPPFSHGQIFFNDRISEQLSIDFFATGQVRPKGTVTFQDGLSKTDFALTQLFLQEENGRLAPIHPTDIK